MIAHFNDFNQRIVGAGSGNIQSVRRELLPISVVEFVAMTMSFVDQVGTVMICRVAAVR